MLERCLVALWLVMQQNAGGCVGSQQYASFFCNDTDTLIVSKQEKKISSPVKIHTTNGRIIAGIKQVALRPINVLLELVGHGGRESSVWLFL
jgi:hypothetical protein